LDNNWRLENRIKKADFRFQISESRLEEGGLFKELNVFIEN